MFRIEASQLPDDFQGGGSFSGRFVSDPEVEPGGGILWVDAKGLAIGFL
jgi:hypothetical protein